MPVAVTPPTAARVRDLSAPERKMSKSTRDAAGVVFLLDPPDLIRRKVARAVTDSADGVAYLPDERPGAANLIEIYAACAGISPKEVEFGSYGELKSAVADALIEELRPVRERVQELLAEPGELDRIRAEGAQRARERGAHRLSSALRLAGVG